MDDKLTPMEAEVLELPTQKADQPSDFYGTAAPQATKNDHTAMWILLSLSGRMPSQGQPFVHTNLEYTGPAKPPSKGKRRGARISPSPRQSMR